MERAIKTSENPDGKSKEELRTFFHRADLTYTKEMKKSKFNDPNVKRWQKVTEGVEKNKEFVKGEEEALCKSHLET